MRDRIDGVTEVVNIDRWQAATRPVAELFDAASRWRPRRARPPAVADRARWRRGPRGRPPGPSARWPRRTPSASPGRRAPGKSTLTSAIDRPSAGAGCTRWRCWPSIRRRRSPAARSSATGCACRTTPPIPACSSARWRPAATSAGCRWPRRRPSGCSTPSAARGSLSRQSASARSRSRSPARPTRRSSSSTPAGATAVQANKAGLMEIADIFVINKADRKGVDETRRDLEQMLDLSDLADDAGGRRSCRPWRRPAKASPSCWDGRRRPPGARSRRRGELDAPAAVPARRGAARDRRPPPRAAGPRADHRRAVGRSCSSTSPTAASIRGPPPTRCSRLGG